MCGIAGIFGTFDPGVLTRMSDRLAHRGPDDQGVWWDAANRLGFAHRRLAIIDLSAAGAQPLWDCSRRAVIVFNGEIYNYRELARGLRRDGFAFQTATDTEVLLNLYLRDGERFLAQLNGIYAFALWDAEKKRLLVARDGPGVKPLYYTEGPAGFAFASELKALAALPELDRTLDYTALSHYLTFLYSPSARTPFKAVRKLEPGRALLVEQGRIVKSWSHASLPVLPPQEGRDRVALQEELETRLARAVRRQMIADVPVGAFLSGGLDSSALAIFARRHARDQRLECFTIGFKDGAAGADGFPDDLPYAQRVARHLSVPLHVAWSGSEMAGEFERMVYHLDEPQPDPAALNVLQISRLARDAGIKVLLSGAGGDDLFSGYRRHRALRLEPWWSWLPAGARRMLQGAAQRVSRGSPRGRRLAKAFQFAGDPEARRIAGYFAWLAPELVAGLFAPEARGQLAEADPLAPMLAAQAALPAATTPLARMLHLEQRFFLPDHNLNYTDKMAMAAGVEVRVPFLDPELMTFAAGLPDDLKQRGATGKWLFKRTMEAHLPRDIVHRPKTGFGAPLRRWMRQELRGHFEQALAPETIRRRGIFDADAVTRLVHQDRTGRADAAYPLFGLVCIETWCRQFVDAPN